MNEIYDELNNVYTNHNDSKVNNNLRIDIRKFDKENMDKYYSTLESVRELDIYREILELGKNKIILEDYIGKVKIVTDTIEFISSLRKLIPIEKKIDNESIEKMEELISKYSANLAKTLNIQAVYINLFDQYTVSTFPIGLGVESKKIKDVELIIGDNGYRFKDENTFKIIIGIGIPVLIDKYLDDDMIASAIFHEIGHSFFYITEFSINRSYVNSFIQIIVKNLKILYTFIRMLNDNSVSNTKDIVTIIVILFTNIFNNILGIIFKYKEFDKELAEEEIKRIEKEILQEKIAIQNNSKYEIPTMSNINEKKNWIIDIIRKIISIFDINIDDGSNPMSFVSKIILFLSNPLFFLSAKLFEIIQKITVSILSLFPPFTTSILIVFIENPFILVEVILNNTILIEDRLNEKFSDKISAVYGLGPQLSKYLFRIYELRHAKSNEKNPINFLISSNMILNTILVELASSHPSERSRIKNIYESLKQELQENKSLTTFEKNAIMKELEEIESIYNKLISFTENSKEGRIVRGLLYSIFRIFIELKKEKKVNTIENIKSLKLTNKVIDDLTAIIKQ